MNIEDVNIAPHFLNFQFKTCIKTKKIPVTFRPLELPPNASLKYAI